MKTTSAPALSALRIPVEVGELDGDLRLPPRPVGLVLFAHGSGSGRRSPRNRFVAETLASSGCATLLFDLLTADEAAADEATGDYRFDIPLLARRLAAVTRWVKAQPDIGALKPGYFGASTGAAAALVAAAEWGGPIAAVVSRGGRPDLAAASLPRVKAPTLLIVGGRDTEVLRLNAEAHARLTCEKELKVIPGATHLFEEQGALEQVAELAAAWFEQHFAPRPAAPAQGRQKRDRKGGPRLTTLPFHLFAGPASLELARTTAALLDHPISPSTVAHFADGESTVRLDVPVRDQPVFILQSAAPPVTENLFLLLQFIDAARRSGARSVTAIVPYLGYSRADRRNGRREALTGSMVADLLEAAGLSELITVDLHSPQIEGFYRIPVDNLNPVATFCSELQPRLPPDTVVVSPDAGRLKTATAYAQRLGFPVATLAKEREVGGGLHVHQIIGEVRGRTCLIIDDMITTGTTIVHAVEALLEAGANAAMTVAATHGVLAPGCEAPLGHPAIREILVSDSVAAHGVALPQLRTVSIAPLLAAGVQRLVCRETVDDRGT